MSDFQYAPRKGDKVLVTVYAVARGEGCGFDVSGPDFEVKQPDPFGFGPSAPCVAKVEPAPRNLPTEYGALILANVGGRGIPCLLRLDRDGDWTNEGCVAGVDEILPGWDQIDPDTLRPVDQP